MIEHAIQLRFLGVKELHLETFWPVPTGSGYSPAAGVLQYSSGAFHSEERTLQVRLRFLSGRDSTPTPVEIEQMKKTGEQPFHLRAEVVGEFHVDTDRFPEDKITEWAKANAPLTLLPFLREQVYALSLRSGFQPLLLPMMVVPTLIRTDSGTDCATVSPPDISAHWGLSPELDLPAVPE